MDVFVIKDLFAKSGLELEIRAETNGPDALTYLSELDQLGAEEGPALVILDLNLPRLSGFEVLRRLRNMTRWSKTPVIIVTSSSIEHDRDTAWRLGATEYFRKPTDLETYGMLVGLVRRVLNLPGARVS